MKKFILMMCFAVIAMSCNSDDDGNSSQPDITGVWNLVNVSGGLAGVNQDIPRGEITWDFQGDMFVVDSSISTGFTLKSGSYSFEMGEDDGNYFLLRNNGDYHEKITIIGDRMALDPNVPYQGIAIADGFFLEFER